MPNSKSSGTCRALLAFVLCALAARPSELQAQEPPRLQIQQRHAQDWLQLTGTLASSIQRVSLLASSNLSSWETAAVIHAQQSFRYADPGSASQPQRFYRATARPMNPAEDDWKNQVTFPGDGFSDPYLDLSWIKFTIKLDDPTRVYYANQNYRFHHSFVAARVEPFRGINAAEFERISLFNTDRRLVLGTVLLPRTHFGEYGIQLVSEDVLPPELVAQIFKLVESTVVSDLPLQPIYVPTFEQVVMTQTNGSFFESNGISTATAERWASGDISYSAGWAVGTLKYFPASGVSAAYASGQLRPEDILLIDGVPAELPYVAGLVTLTPATPNSHVAILARSYQVPFGYFIREQDRFRIRQLTNRVVVLQTCSVGTACRALLVPVDDTIAPEDRARLDALRAPATLNLTTKRRAGVYSAPADPLTPADIATVGGKAANFGLLRRVVPEHSPPAVALTFDLWDDFMDQMLFGGTTLRQEISNRLAGLDYPQDIGAIQTELAGIRSLIRQGTVFTPAQEQAITNALGMFDPLRNIRFRSSTNVEDSESFSGAGLYDSYSGCLADDRDGDSTGPSHCDPAEEDECGVLRAIRRVYASFYNDNAYLERLRLGVDETQVGMAVLVHHSAPDETELANGVGTATWISRSGDPFFSGRMVTQLGAVSVANPETTALPEDVSLAVSPSLGTIVSHVQSSSLVRLGETVMTWDRDYVDLANLLFQVGQGYSALFPGKPRFQLDFEYKKITPDHLQVKQVRQIPTAVNSADDVLPFVLDTPADYHSWHGYYDDLWMAHRIKSRWTVRHRNTFFARTNLLEDFYTHIAIEHLDGAEVRTMSGAPSTFPNAQRELVPYATFNPERVFTRDSWTMNTLAGPADVTLQLLFDPLATSQAPFGITARSTVETYRLEVNFHQPVLTISVHGDIDYRTNTVSRLYVMPEETPDSDRRTKNYRFSNNGMDHSIEVDYVLPREAVGDDCRCPIIRIERSRLEGFTGEPIVLRGYWSQTFNDVHTMDSEEFLFEPRLEENLPPAQLAELEAADIGQIYVNGQGILFVVGLDGTPRRLSSL